MLFKRVSVLKGYDTVVSAFIKELRNLCVGWLLTGF
jgi:hypothetical protein